jgi:hypothetical protein
MAADLVLCDRVAPDPTDAECPIVIKDKRGNAVTKLCF